tara:strand:+ start:341 stop:649 length:309 start_codon:yes stop_codon:yes gene_type:complete
MGIVKLLKPKTIAEAKEKLKFLYKGKEGSPFKLLDDLGKKPDYRNPKDEPGTEKKKLKEAGKKASEKFKKNNPTKTEGSFKSGGRVCKLAKRGVGRAYGKNS